MKQSRPFSQMLLWSAMAVVIVAVIATGILTNITLRSIEKNLPNTLLSQLHDLTLILEDLAEVVSAAERTKVTPTSENITRLRNKVIAVYDGVVKLRNTYVFDNLIQASAFHAVVAPAIADLQIWLSEGVSGYGPETDATVDIALSRISQAFQKARALNYDSRTTARNMLDAQRNRLDRFLFSVNLLFMLTIVITAIMVILFIRQHVLKRREVLTQAELMRAERSIQESEELYSKLIAAIPDWVVRTDVDGHILFVNEIALQMSGYNRTDLEGKNILQFISPEDHEKAVENMKRMFDRTLGPKEYHLLMKDGTKLLFEVNSDVLRWKDGSPYGIVNVCRDITERKKVEDALRESEANLRSIFRAAPTGIGMVCDRVITQANERLCEILGYSRKELLGESSRMLYPTDEEFECVGREKYSQIRTQGTGTVETRWQRKDGKVIDVLLSSTPIDLNDLSVGVTFAALDISSRKQAESALRESEEKYRSVIESIKDGYFEVDIAGNFTFFNDSMCRILRYPGDELMGMNNREYMDKEYAKKIYQTFNQVYRTGESTKALDWKLLRKDGSECFVETVVSLIKDSNGQPIGFRGIARDVTERKSAERERKRLEVKLQQAQKMESLGTLAGGIAHDFNNLLMGIQGRASLMMLDTAASHAHTEHLKGIEDYVKSAADLTKQLLGFARGGKYEVRTIDLNALVKNQNYMFGRTKKEIKIQVTYKENLWTVDADQGQIEQVLLNVYVNAWQAMPGGGDLYIRTDNIIIDDNFNKPYHAETGRYVRISITDTGVGMDRATQQRIFDPFFTTKEMGRGTGLGLASAYGIIKNHGGFIDVYSEKGKGATFNIYFPASEKEAVKKDEIQEELLKGTETILLIDDEDMIIDVGQATLHTLGYTVLSAKSGKDAIQIYRKNQNKIDMVILDMIMPEMSGGETYDRLKEINPDIKVLLSSGYSVDGQATEILNRGCNGFIQKPFNMGELSKKMREVLENETTK